MNVSKMRVIFRNFVCTIFHIQSFSLTECSFNALAFLLMMSRRGRFLENCWSTHTYPILGQKLRYFRCIEDAMHKIVKELCLEK